MSFTADGHMILGGSAADTMLGGFGDRPDIEDGIGRFKFAPDYAVDGQSVNWGSLLESQIRAIRADENGS